MAGAEANAPLRKVRTAEEIARKDLLCRMAAVVASGLDPIQGDADGRMAAERSLQIALHIEAMVEDKVKKDSDAQHARALERLGRR